MTDANAELLKLRTVCPGAELWTEDGKPVVFLPGLRFPCGKKTIQRDGLLVPWERDGYESRLYLSAKVEEKGALNWQTGNLQGRTWHTWSWKGVRADRSWMEVLAGHLWVLR